MFIERFLFNLYLSSDIFFRRIANVGENCPCKILPCKLANCPTTTPFLNRWGGVTPPPHPPNSYAPGSVE